MGLQTKHPHCQIAGQINSSVAPVDLDYCTKQIKGESNLKIEKHQKRLIQEGNKAHKTPFSLVLSLPFYLLESTRLTVSSKLNLGKLD